MEVERGQPRANAGDRSISQKGQTNKASACQPLNAAISTGDTLLLPYFNKATAAK